MKRFTKPKIFRVQFSLILTITVVLVTTFTANAEPLLYVSYRTIPTRIEKYNPDLHAARLRIEEAEPGKEILNPVAIVIVGGLISATLLGLAVTPAIFYQFCRKAAARALERGAAAAS